MIGLIFKEKVTTEGQSEKRQEFHNVMRCDETTLDGDTGFKAPETTSQLTLCHRPKLAPKAASRQDKKMETVSIRPNLPVRANRKLLTNLPVTVSRTLVTLHLCVSLRVSFPQWFYLFQHELGLFLVGSETV